MESWETQQVKAQKNKTYSKIWVFEGRDQTSVCLGKPRQEKVSRRQIPATISSFNKQGDERFFFFKRVQGADYGLTG